MFNLTDIAHNYEDIASRSYSFLITEFLIKAHKKSFDEFVKKFGKHEIYSGKFILVWLGYRPEDFNENDASSVVFTADADASSVVFTADADASSYIY